MNLHLTSLVCTAIQFALWSCPPPLEHRHCWRTTKDIGFCVEVGDLKPGPHSCVKVLCTPSISLTPNTYSSSKILKYKKLNLVFMLFARSLNFFVPFIDAHVLFSFPTPAWKPLFYVVFLCAFEFLFAELHMQLNLPSIPSLLSLDSFMW